nr:hypothetical protein [Tanacetum cinerariifolium]
TPTEPHHTPSPEAPQSPQHEPSSSSLPPVITEPIPTVIPTATPPHLGNTPGGLGLLNGGVADQSGDDAPIKGMSLETREETGAERSTERGSDDTEELVNVLISLDAAKILTSGGVQVSIPSAAEVATVSIPPAGEIPTGSGVVPTASFIFTTASVVTPYTRRKGKKKMVESETPKKQKLQEQMNVQMARQLEEEMARDAQRMNEQIARDAEIARIHAEEELQMLIDGPSTSNGTTLEKIKEKFDPVWKQIQDFIPIADPVKEVYVEALQIKHPIIDWEIYTEGQRSYWKIIRLRGSSANYQFFVDMLKHFDRKDLNQLWALVKETLSIRPATSDKEKEIWVELKRLYEPDVEDQLWTHTQNMMHAQVEWKLYDTCGVHHVIFKDQEIFMLVEKDYPLRKGLAIVMISYKLHVENYSRMANDLKIYKIANSIPTASDKFPLPVYIPTASEDMMPLLSQRDATAEELCAAEEDKYAKFFSSGISLTHQWHHIFTSSVNVDWQWELITGSGNAL